MTDNILDEERWAAIDAALSVRDWAKAIVLIQTAAGLSFVEATTLFHSRRDFLQSVMGEAARVDALSRPPSLRCRCGQALGPGDVVRHGIYQRNFGANFVMVEAQCSACEHISRSFMRQGEWEIFAGLI